MILVTGGTGFVGSALRLKLSGLKMPYRYSVRNFSQKVNEYEAIEVIDNSSKTDWTLALKNIDQIVHLAARVHIMNDQADSPLEEFRRVNVGATANLARQAAAAGVKRFIFISSIKVNGEITHPGGPFAADDVPAPEDPYAISKHEAELELRKISEETGMQLVIIRPPLVYGPGVKANFDLMLRLLRLRLPLPFSGITKNRRSMVSLFNLIDLIIICIWHPAAAGEIFLVSDGEDLSTENLLRRVSYPLGMEVKLFYLPEILMRLIAIFFGKKSSCDRLFGSLQIDMEKTKRLLNWSPPLSVDEGFMLMSEGVK